MYLVEEATLFTVPEHMRILFERFSGEYLTQENLLVGLLYLLILECGFAHQTDPPEESRDPFVGFYSCSGVRKAASSIPIKSLRVPRSFQEHTFCLLSFHKDFTLVTYRLSDSLCATFTPKSLSGFSICLSISRYIPLINRKSILRSFRNLPELSLITKNKLILPARDIFMQNIATLAPYPSLIGMPEIVLELIFRLLPKNSQKNLAQACDRLRQFQIS